MESFLSGELFVVTDEEPSRDALKALHKLIKKVTSDIEQFSFNTSVSAFMICLNELTALKCRNRTVLSDLVVCLAPLHPISRRSCGMHWATRALSVMLPALWNEEYLKEDTFAYAISFNGKSRFVIEFAADASNDEIQQAVLAHPSSQKWLEGKHRRR